MELMISLDLDQTPNCRKYVPSLPKQDSRLVPGRRSEHSGGTGSVLPVAKTDEVLHALHSGHGKPNVRRVEHRGESE